MKQRPLIGINPYFFEEHGSYWNATKQRYYKAIWAGGGLPVTLHHPHAGGTTTEIAKRIDGLLMVGGDDVPAETYKSSRPELLADPPMRPEREAFDRSIYQVMEYLGKPILAICVGLHHINVIRGGTLYEDLNALLPNPINHGTFNGPWVEHPVVLEPDCLTARVMGTTTPDVASTHHQGICKLGQGLRPVGRSADGLVEAMENLNGSANLIAVQWHPELQPGRPEQVRLFNWLSSTAAQHA